MILTQIMLWSEAAQQKAIARLLREDVVAIPTETVYGLAALMFSPVAVDRIFEWKGRPSNNPLIVHVRDLEQALSLCRLNPTEERVFLALSKRFWPGPLTLVVPRAAQVPLRVTAGGEAVALRCPAHPVAQALLALCAQPLVAPSANLSGHVSPTSAAHVAQDFADRDLLVIDGGACRVGLESTVARIRNDGCVEILRAGFVPASELGVALADAGLTHRIDPNATRYDAGVGEEAFLAPGQLLAHYAPRVPTYLHCGLPDSGPVTLSGSAPLSRTAALDFGGALLGAKGRFFAYRDLSREGVIRDAEAGLYEALRWSEALAGVQALVVPALPEGEAYAALRDRLHRAASGRKARFNFAVDRVFF